MGNIGCRVNFGGELGGVRPEPLGGSSMDGDMVSELGDSMPPSIRPAAGESIPPSVGEAMGTSLTGTVRAMVAGGRSRPPRMVKGEVASRSSLIASRMDTPYGE